MQGRQNRTLGRLGSNQKNHFIRQGHVRCYGKWRWSWPWSSHGRTVPPVLKLFDVGTLECGDVPQHSHLDSCLLLFCSLRRAWGRRVCGEGISRL